LIAGRGPVLPEGRERRKFGVESFHKKMQALAKAPQKALEIVDSPIKPDKEES